VVKDSPIERLLYETVLAFHGYGFLRLLLKRDLLSFS
jgi:hypothetical protein